MRSDTLAAAVKLAVALALACVILRGLSHSLTAAASPINGALTAQR